MSATEHVEHLLRILRRYADSSIGPLLVKELRELSECGRAGLVALEVGSDERIADSVLAAVHMKLAEIVDELYLEIGTARVDARKWLEGVDPSDFDGESW